MHHELKCWPQFFDDVATGRKKFEYRKDDRDYSIPDFLTLREYIPDEDRYTGRQIFAQIDYILRGKDCPGVGIPEGYCIMGIHILWSGRRGDNALGDISRAYMLTDAVLKTQGDAEDATSTS